MCTAASAANYSYMNTTGGMVYVMEQPSSWAVIGGFPATVTLPGAGPAGTDAYYRSGVYQGNDDSTQVYWDFVWANLANFGQTNPATNPPQYAIQTYVSNYGGLAHENDGVYGTRNGPWGWNAMGAFSSWNGAGQANLGWQNIGAWVGGYAWLSNTGDPLDVRVAAKWNPWGGYGGLAVSGVRISTNGNFIPEPSSLLALLAAFPALALLRRKH